MPVTNKRGNGKRIEPGKIIPGPAHLDYIVPKFHYPVEKNIPIPLVRGGKGLRKWPIDKMEVGDSFFSLEYGGVRKSAKILGIKITTRQVEEDGVKGIRVWRIK